MDVISLKIDVLPEIVYEKLFTNIIYIALWDFCWFELAMITIKPKIGLFDSTNACVQIIALTHPISDI